MLCQKRRNSLEMSGKVNYIKSIDTEVENNVANIRKKIEYFIIDYFSDSNI